ncbi:Mediator of RNA polymerase II transcription subunit 13 [Vitis vinifera]|uniref:Mediator of RNA polymerase II transcription subunit 13 n=1 Tax=Vitis vinifera TaxID=29760 RepID=A0A438ELZ6_VITVI|nr:Mediator of RNA polymerase II transcription subunit 13 [Vitis vinifera]
MIKFPLILIITTCLVKPPGTAESHALIFPAPDCEGSSPCTGMMDVSDQMLLSVGFQSFDNFNPSPPVAMEECLTKNQEVTNNTLSSGPLNYTPASSIGEFDHLIKAEALLTFAPEYGAVETPTSESSSSIFRSPYLPKSRKVESSNSSAKDYVYGATPPSSPCFDGSDEKPGMPVNSKTCPVRHEASSILHSKKYYTHVEGGKEQHEKRSFTCDNSIASGEGLTPSSFSGFNSTNATKPVQRKTTEGTIGMEHLVYL